MRIWYAIFSLLSLLAGKFRPFEHSAGVQARNQDFMWRGANEAKVDQTYQSVFFV